MLSTCQLASVITRGRLRAGFALRGGERAGSSEDPQVSPAGRGGRLSPSPLSAWERQDGPTGPALLPWQQPLLGSQLSKEPVGSAPPPRLGAARWLQGLWACGSLLILPWSVFWFKAHVTQV